MRTWWQEWDEFAGANRNGHDQTLEPHLVALLDDVEARSVAAGGDAMRWDDPHAIPGEDFARCDTEPDHNRVTNPGRFAVAGVRFHTWVDALTAPLVANGGQPLADVVVDDALGAAGLAVGWPDRDARRTVNAMTVTPRNGAPSIRLTTREAWDPGDLLLFDVGVSTTPAPGANGRDDGLGPVIFRAMHTPDCACDACDHGSDELLKEIDQWILSIVDGSFEIIARDDTSSTRTSFFGGSNLGDADATAETHTVVGRSWWPGKRSRPVIPPV